MDVYGLNSTRFLLSQSRDAPRDLYTPNYQKQDMHKGKRRVPRIQLTHLISTIESIVTFLNVISQIFFFCVFFFFFFFFCIISYSF